MKTVLKIKSAKAEIENNGFKILFNVEPKEGEPKEGASVLKCKPEAKEQKPEAKEQKPEVKEQKPEVKTKETVQQIIESNIASYIKAQRMILLGLLKHEIVDLLNISGATYARALRKMNKNK